MRTRRKRKHHLPDPILTPMIDTFATLLVMFIITAPMVQNSIRVNLPHGKSKEITASQDIIITLSKDEKIFFNNYPIDKKNLITSVQKSLIKKDDLPVFVKADRRISYGKVIELVDQLKEAGVRYVAMSTQPT